MTAAIVVGVDQLTKWMLRESIGADAARQRIDVIGDRAGLQIHQNDGVAFGALAGGGRATIILVAAALSLLTFVLIRYSGRSRVIAVAGGLIVGGATGNLIDRFVHGSVTDFVDIPPWPAFNVGDAAITTGVVVLAWYAFRSDRVAGEARGQAVLTPADSESR